MSDKGKVFTKKKCVRIDKMTGRLPDCLHDEAEALIDERGYSPTDFLAEGVRSLSSKEGIMNRMKTIAHVETTVSGEGA